jgi:hypothetical protein
VQSLCWSEARRHIGLVPCRRGMESAARMGSWRTSWRTSWLRPLGFHPPTTLDQAFPCARVGSAGCENVMSGPAMNRSYHGSHELDACALSLSREVVWSGNTRFLWTRALAVSTLHLQKYKHDSKIRQASLVACYCWANEACARALQVQE